MQNARWKRRPEGSTWGDFGPDDQLGRLNLITPEKVRQGAAEIREGLTFCLSLPLEYPGGAVLNPRRLPPVLRPTRRGDAVNMNYQLGRDHAGATDVLSDDLALLHLQYSTQWDSFAHVGSMFDADGDGVPEPLYYNGFRAGEDVVGPERVEDCGAPEGHGPSTSGARRLGIENFAVKGMQGRAVMIDLHAHVGRAREIVGYDQLMRIMEKDGVEIETGDMVCLHTGFGEFLLELGGKPTHFAVENACAVLDGRDERLLQWITDSGMVALIADNYSVEAYPARPAGGDCCAQLPLHQHCLFRLGVPLGELWHLTPLANWLRANGRYRFFLTAPPLRLTGAVGSPATPIGTV